MQLILLFLFCFLGIVLNADVPIALTDLSDLIVIGIGLGVLVLSKYITNFFLNGESDKEKYVLKIFYVSFIISLLFLKFCWSPFLLPSSENWGFDPQRYYIYAIQVVKNGYFDGWVGSGFDGIVYFYAFLFKLVGYHPLIPLYLNVLLSLLSVLMLYSIFRKSLGNNVKYVSLLLLIPELLYYNVMSAKDTLSQFSLVFIFYFFYRMYWLNKRKAMLPLILSLFFLMFLRLPYGFTAMLVLMIYITFFTNRFSKATKMCIIFIFIPIAIWGLNLASAFSFNDSFQEDLGTRIESYTSGSINAIEHGSAIASYLTPHNSVEVIIFGFIRSIVYLFPEGHCSFFDKYQLSTFGSLTQLISGIMSAVFIGVACLYTKYVFCFKQNKGIVLFLICSLFLLLISFSTPNFIHQRYRISIDYFYYLMIILAFSQIGKVKCLKMVKCYIFSLSCLSFIYSMVKLF